MIEGIIAKYKETQVFQVLSDIHGIKVSGRRKSISIPAITQLTGFLDVFYWTEGHLLYLPGEVGAGRDVEKSLNGAGIT